MADIQRIKEIRDTREVSIFEARRLERVERLTVAISEAKTVDDLKSVLSELLGEVAWAS